jgi:CRISPR/Cas system CMR subunit Cmr4 (Cas7 group RAMP superfamily)
MKSIIHQLIIPLRFPEGIHPGAGRSGNSMIISTDGQGRPVLRGTALAGALRHAWLAANPDQPRQAAAQMDKLFGRKFGRDDTEPEHDHDEHSDPYADVTPYQSRLRFEDCVLVSQGATPQVRTHIGIDRHTGAVRNGSLFSLEALPPDTRTTACIWLHDDGESTAAESVLRELVGFFEQGLTLGGNVARGIGRAVCDGSATLASYNCTLLEQHADYLDAHYQWRKHGKSDGGKPITGLLPESVTDLKLVVELGIPRGEDLLLGDGQGTDHEMEPQRVKSADGKEYWRIPGSSLRGVLRSWISHLVAMDENYTEKLDDSLVAWRREIENKSKSKNKNETVEGKGIAWGIGKKDDEIKTIQQRLANDPSALLEEVPCPVMRLFGSGYAKGRLHVTDALSDRVRDPAHEQVRAHVAVDRITGGANEGFFFQNAVLKDDISFRFTITVRDPEEQEARWLKNSLRAIDLGILRIGSSKSGGRLALKNKPEANGPCHELFNELTPSEV